jgi:hypothetical protein
MSDATAEGAESVLVLTIDRKDSGSARLIVWPHKTCVPVNLC